jgi:hypothetical protein
MSVSTDDIGKTIAGFVLFALGLLLCMADLAMTFLVGSPTDADGHGLQFLNYRFFVFALFVFVAGAGLMWAGWLGVRFDEQR